MHEASGKEPGHVGFVPAGSLAAAAHAGWRLCVALQQVQRNLPEHCPVLCGRSLADATAVLVEALVEYPVQTVFDRPMPTDRLNERLIISRTAA